MAVFPKGREAISAAVAKSKRKGGGSGRSMFWQDGDEKIIQFVTPIDEVCRIEHYNVRVGTYEDSGNAMMRDFVDPRSIGMGDDNPIADREWTHGKVPSRTKLAAVVVELVEVGSGRNKTFEVATREYENKDGEDVTVPNVGIIIQSPTFWSWFESYADRKGVDLTGEAFVVERVEGSQPVKYNVIQLGDGLDLSEEVTGAIDLEAYLEELASPDRLHEFIDPLKDTHVLDKFAQKKKGGKDAKASSKPAARSRAAKAVEDDESDEGADETVDRKAAFDGLKAALKG